MYIQHCEKIQVIIYGWGFGDTLIVSTYISQQVESKFYTFINNYYNSYIMLLFKKQYDIIRLSMMTDNIIKKEE